jgi:hypothetical protein
MHLRMFPQKLLDSPHFAGDNSQGIADALHKPGPSSWTL